MPRVQVEGVGVIEFPEGFTPEQITSAIERDILPRKAAGKIPDVGAARKAIAEDVGPIEAGAVGAGRVVDQVLKGGKQLGLRMATAFADSPIGAYLPNADAGRAMLKGETDKLRAEEAEAKKGYDALTDAHPVATTVGEIVGNLPAGMVGSGYAAAAASGALPGLLSYGDDSERAVAGAAGAAGGILGTAFGKLLGKFISRGGARPLADAERAALVNAADELGIDLTPEQITGKTWQRNLAAALRQNPATSGLFDAITLKQQGQVDNAAARALAKAGGHIDQPSAGAAATRGMQKGVEAEAARIDQAYRDVLQGVDVDLSGTRAPLNEILAGQKRLPDTLAASKGVAAIEELVGSPNYGKQARAPWRPPALDTTRDDILLAIRKNGGVDPGDPAVGSLAKANPFSPDPQNGPVWRTRGDSMATKVSTGHSLDRMAQLLRDQGYPVDGPDDVMDAIAEATLGRSIFADAFDHGAAQRVEDPLASAIDKLTNQLYSKSAPPAPQAGRLRTDLASVPGELAQDMRSGYRVKADEAFAKGDANAQGVFSGIKGVIDDAIDKAVPAAERGQFQAINERYGMGKAIQLLPKRDQQQLLAQIYRGFGSEDEFAAFVGMSPDKEFQEVARGFLSNLVDKSRDAAGHVNPAKLGRDVRAASPDARRMLGGDPGTSGVNAPNAAPGVTVNGQAPAAGMSPIDMIEALGGLGEKVLPDLGNSQTANRALYQQLITLLATSGPGALAGGYAGGDGTDMGSLLGAGAGAFLAPQAVARAYLSPALRPLLTKAASSGPNALGRAVSPELEAMITRLLGAMGGAGGLAATQ